MEAKDFSALRISLASPEQIKSWSYGEVTKPETINYRRLRPEKDGLFCEAIFGPTKDWQCYCGKYKNVRYKGIICDKCGVEVTRTSVRRERMGHIELAAPIAHPWYARATPNVIAQLLDCSPSRLAAVLSYSASVVISVDDEMRQATLLQVDPHDETEQRLASVLSRLAPLDLLEEPTARALSMLYGQVFRAGTGAGAVRELLLTLDLDALSTELRQAIRQDTPRRRHAIRRLHLVEALRRSGVHPAHMILDVLPVLPPDLRPLVELEGVRLATSDVNTLYERILCRNERIKHFRTLGAPTIMLNYEQRLLQDACNALFVGKHTVTGSKKPPLKSLTAALSGKRGRFRHNLLGKRVDYSGRSVIVGDATLQLQQCGLPTSICLELFKPFLMRRLLSRHLAPTARAAKRMVERAGKHDLLFWDILEEVMYEKVVLLNRAPTLHRLSIQAFEPLRVEGSAIRLHPLVCSAFNADFDGDQMAVHLPLSDAAQREARTRLLSTRNLRSPASGEPSISIAQEMVLGLFYLTQVRPGTKRANRVFADVDEVMLVLEAGVIDLHTPLVVRVPDQHISESPGSSAPPPLRRRIETTAGRLIFNEALPQALRYKNYEMTKERIKQLVVECLRVLGEPATAQVADALKTLGFHYATRSGISFAISDIEVPAEKQEILARADAEVEAIEELHQAGMIDTSERSRQRIDLWTKATDEVSQHLEGRLDPWGSLATIIKSGATKAKFQQIRQLSGCKSRN